MRFDRPGLGQWANLGLSLKVELQASYQLGQLEGIPIGVQGDQWKLQLVH